MGLVVQINDKTKQCPICWEEATTEQYQRVKALRNLVDHETGDLNLLAAFCALNNENFDKVAETESDEIDTVLYQCSSFVFNQEEYFRSLEPPSHFKIGNKAVIVPRELGSLTIQQNLILRQAMWKLDTCLEQLISLAVSVYLQPLIDGDDKGKAPFSFARSKEIEKEVLKMPIEKTFPVGFFYLSKLNNFGRSGLLVWLQRLLRRTSYGRRLLNWLTLSVCLFSMSLPSLNNTQAPLDNSLVSLSKNHLTTSCQSYGSGKKDQSTMNDTEYSINS